VLGSFESRAARYNALSNSFAVLILGLDLAKIFVLAKAKGNRLKKAQWRASHQDRARVLLTNCQKEA